MVRSSWPEAPSEKDIAGVDQRADAAEHGAQEHIGGFARYRYRDSLFPSLVFRRAYDAIHEGKGTSTASDLVYSRVLHLAAATLESDVQAGLELLLEQGITPCVEALQELIKKDNSGRCLGFRCHDRESTRWLLARVSLDNERAMPLRLARDQAHASSLSLPQLRRTAD